MIRDYTGQPGAQDGKEPKPKPETPRVVKCPDCGAAVPETLEPGRHAPRRIGSKLVNCVGRVLE